MGNTIIADVHLHSHYSRATSKNLDFEHLTQWAQMKGVNIVGTGDIAHPGWLQEMRDKLEPAEEGLFRLKDDVASAVQQKVPAACQGAVRFMLAGEISSIYKKNDRVRKVHNVIFAPTLEAVEKIQIELEKIGNIRSDGRPILGLPSRDLLEIILEIDPQCYLIPAHIWTPWFSMLGSKSGYDSLEECFEDLSDHIFAVETGLSSDPPMNWRVSWLDKYTLVSNSDAHSPQKLAREANVFDTELAYPAIFDALKTGDPAHFRGTIEFFPEEGKYHYDGHRKCNIRWTPKTTLAHDTLCAVCGKPVTVGVMHRVEVLADRAENAKPMRAHPYQCLIPLPEILSEVHGVGPTSKRVQKHYMALLSTLGSELSILQDLPLADIEQAGGALLAEGVRRVRTSEVTIAAGYDGEYGVVKLFDKQERASFGAQMGLFSTTKTRKQNAASLTQSHADEHRLNGNSPSDNQKSTSPAQPVAAQSNPRPLTMQEQQTNYAPNDPKESAQSVPLAQRHPLTALNPDQHTAATCTDTALAITAGPGTGKTRTLTVRIAHLILDKDIAPASILAITFTNKTAAEMQARLTDLLGAETTNQITVKTFHALGAQILHEAGEFIGLDATFAICSEQDRTVLLRRACPDLSQREISDYLARISDAKNKLLLPGAVGLSVGKDEDAQFTSIFRAYETILEKNHLLDFDDLILRPVQLFQLNPAIQATYQHRFRRISVDEYQDVNDAQYRLLRLLTNQETNLCVIGDPDQAIYGFRGADRSYFLRFQEDFPSARTLHLNQNYRSTQLILDASTQVIEKEILALPHPSPPQIGEGAARALREGVRDETMSSFPCEGVASEIPSFSSRGSVYDETAVGALDKYIHTEPPPPFPDKHIHAEPTIPSPIRGGLGRGKLWSDHLDHTKLEVYQAPTDKAEAEYIVHQIERMVGGTSYFSIDSGRVDDEGPAERTFADFAVLYRLRAQSNDLIEAFDRSGIPYQTFGQTPLADHKEIRTILAHLWFVHSPHSLLHLEQVLNARKSIFNEAALDRLTTFAEEHAITLWDALQDDPLAWISNAAQEASLVETASFLRQLQEKSTTQSVVQLIDQIRVFLWSAKKKALRKAQSTRIEQLMRRATPFEDRLGDFLESIALQKETDIYDPRADRVTLMSLHASKGLEFPVVFIVGCEETLLPYQRGDEECDIEEERRLFYVGMTRAQQKLVLAHAQSRFLFGQRMANAQSRFVADIANTLKEIREAERRAKVTQEASGIVQLKLF